MAAKRYEFRGKKLTIDEIAEVAGVEVSTLRTRLMVGLPLDRPYGAILKRFDFHGRKLTRKEIADELGIGVGTVSDRLSRGKSLTDPRGKQGARPKEASRGTTSTSSTGIPTGLPP
jgi:hypothetical protein